MHYFFIIIRRLVTLHTSPIFPLKSTYLVTLLEFHKLQAMLKWKYVAENKATSVSYFLFFKFFFGTISCTGALSAINRYTHIRSAQIFMLLLWLLHTAAYCLSKKIMVFQLYSAIQWCMVTRFSLQCIFVNLYCLFGICSLEALKVRWFLSTYHTVCFRDVGEIVGKLYEDVDSPPPILMVGHR